MHGGYNWQVQQIVLGVEGDVSFSNNANYLASIRGRLGFAPWDQWLLYGTAGAAFGTFAPSSPYAELRMSQLALHAFEFAASNISNLTWLSDLHQF